MHTYNLHFNMNIKHYRLINSTYIDPLDRVFIYC